MDNSRTGDVGDDGQSPLAADVSMSNSIFAAFATPVRQSPARRALSGFPFAPSPFTVASPSITKPSRAKAPVKMTQHDEACYIDCDVRLDMIAKFPAEISSYIFTFIDDPADFLAFSLVSRPWHAFARDHRNWQQFFLNLHCMGWDTLPNVDELWSKRLLRAYGNKWQSEAKRKRSRQEEPGSATEGVQEEPRSTHDEQDAVGDDIRISASRKEIFQGPIDWFLLFRARRALTHRWGLPLEPLPPLSQEEADAAEQSEYVPGDPATEFLQEYRHDPVTRTQMRAGRTARQRDATSETAASALSRGAAETKTNVMADAKYLSGHQDSIYCVRLDSQPFTVPADVEESLRQRYEDAPLYDPCASLGIGSRGRIFSGSRDRTIKVWDGDSGLLMSTLEGHKGSVLCLEFNQEFLLSGSSDKTVIVWSLSPMQRGEDPKMIKILTGHTAGVLDISMAHGWTITCGKDSTVRVYDCTQDFRCLNVYRGHHGPINAGRIGMHDGKVCAVTASGEGSIQLWQVETGEYLRSFEGHTKGLACAQFLDGLVVSGSNDFTIRVWNATTGECLAVLRDHRDLVRAIAFDPKRKVVVSAGYDGRVKVFDVQRAIHPESATVEGGLTLAAIEDAVTPPFPVPASKDNRRSARAVGSGSTFAGRVFDVQIDATRILSCGENNRICVHDFARESPIMRLFL